MKNFKFFDKFLLKKYILDGREGINPIPKTDYNILYGTFIPHIRVMRSSYDNHFDIRVSFVIVTVIHYHSFEYGRRQTAKCAPRLIDSIM